MRTMRTDVSVNDLLGMMIEKQLFVVVTSETSKKSLTMSIDPIENVSTYIVETKIKDIKTKYYFNNARDAIDKYNEII